METFERIALAKAFFLSRLRLDIVLFDRKRQRPLPLLKALRRKGQLDCPVLVGRQKFPARLVAIKLPEAVAAERRRKAKQNRDLRRQPNATYLALLQMAALVGDFLLQLGLEAWQIRITEALLFQLEHPGRYERRARKHFVQKLMN